MKIAMSVESLKEIFFACKPYTSKDKEWFKQIRLVCSAGRCDATALDGHKVITISIPYEGDEGSMHIPIVKVPKEKNVSIIQNETEITFDFFTEKQTVKRFTEEKSFDTQKLFQVEEPQFTINFSPKFLKDALEGFTDTKSVELSFFGKNKGIILESEKNKKALVLPYYSID